MINANAGGPAFPFTYDDEATLQRNVFAGMTVRDYFAARASEDDIEAHSWKGYTEEFVRDLGNGQKTIDTRNAYWTREQAKYRYADAMIEARKA